MTPQPDAAPMADRRGDVVLVTLGVLTAAAGALPFLWAALGPGDLALEQFAPLAVLAVLLAAVVRRRRARRWRALADELGWTPKEDPGALVDPETPLSGTHAGLDLRIEVTSDPVDYRSAFAYLTQLVAEVPDLADGFRLVVRPRTDVGGFARPGMEDVETGDDRFHDAFHLRSTRPELAARIVRADIRGAVRDLEDLEVLEVREGQVRVRLGGIRTEAGTWRPVIEAVAELVERLPRKE